MYNTFPVRVQPVVIVDAHSFLVPFVQRRNDDDDKIGSPNPIEGVVVPRGPARATDSRGISPRLAAMPAKIRSA